MKRSILEKREIWRRPERDINRIVYFECASGPTSKYVSEVCTERFLFSETAQR